VFDSLRLAVEDMTKLLARVFGLSEADAYVYSTLGGSVRVAGCLNTRGGVEWTIICLGVLLEPLRRRAAE
jgi:hypothetical protein